MRNLNKISAMRANREDGRRWMLLLPLFVIQSFLFISSVAAQEVTVLLTPLQQVLPPQAGQYIDNPGRFFTIRLVNNTDEEQQVHLGLQIKQLFPENVLWVSTNMHTRHIPNQPIILSPRQHKTLNSVETKHIFDHFTSSDVFIKDGRHTRVTDGDFGLMPEGEFEAFLTAYQWDPNLTEPVPLSDPNGGRALFNICYVAQPPMFTVPSASADVPADGGGKLFGRNLMEQYKIHKVNKNVPLFQWTAPTLNCFSTLMAYTYNVRIVELGSMMPDEAMENNTQTFFQKKLSVNTFVIPPFYVNEMMGQNVSEGKVYAMQVQAVCRETNSNPLKFSLIENDGKSDILLFQLVDPVGQPEQSGEDDSLGGGESQGGGDSQGGDDGKQTSSPTSLYTFEQPDLTHPDFSGMVTRKVFLGEDINAAWHRAWYREGHGLRQDTVKFEYTVQLFTGNSADKKEVIFMSAPLLEKKTEELEYTIEWDDIVHKVKTGDYIVMRVLAKPTNTKADEDVRMLGDSLNYVDFAVVARFNENYQCGHERDVANKKPLTEKPAKGQQIKIGQFYMTFDDDVKQEDGGFTGTGWVVWNPTGDRFFKMSARVAVKFEKLKVNTDYEVYEGKCHSRSKDKSKEVYDYTDEQFVDSLFSATGLDNIYGDLSLPADVQQSLSNFYDEAGKPQLTSLAKGYNLGKYYSKYCTGRKVWDQWKSDGSVDLYFPVEMPDAVKQFLPDDFSLQIASMQFTPSSAQMNILGEVALPNSDVFDGQDMLIFGAPRLCISPDQFLPEEGVLALLSHLALKDPSSDFRMVFKAPSDPLDPQPGDGCFLRWANGGFGGLGLELAVSIPNTSRLMDGEVKEDIPALLDLKTTILANESAGDFIATGTMTPFRVKDLPGWTFHVGDEVVFDHNMDDNDKLMPSLEEVTQKFGSTYDPRQCGAAVQADWNAWQGVYIKEVSVELPKFAVFGKGDKGVTIGARDMLFDGSGVSCHVFADNILDGETGEAGGWKFTIDDVNANIVQNNFDNCVITGGFGVPLFGKKAAAKANEKAGIKDNGGNGSGSTVETDVTYTCEIRHLTDPSQTEEYYTYVQKVDSKGEPVKGEYEKVKHTRSTYGEASRYAYIFKCEEVDDLQMNCFVADLTLLQNQTYFLLEAEDQADGSTKTEVELCMAGDITIAGVNSINESIKAVTAGLPIDLTLPGIHFAKMRLSNVKREGWSLGYEKGENGLQTKRDNAEKKWEDAEKSRTILVNDGALELGDNCFFNYGEWSLASEKKKIGPFSFSIDKFDFGFEKTKLSLGITGTLGLIGDKIEATAGIIITSELEKTGSGVADWSLSNGKIAFREAALGLDFSAIRLDGSLKVSDDAEKKGYVGKLAIAITGLFELSCEGGYYKSDKSWAVSTNELSEMEADAKEANETLSSQEKSSYTWGYFKVSMESNAGLRFDPLVINRISGGFYFNCRPTRGSDKDKDKFGGEPVGQYGMIGIAMGLGLNTTAGKETLNADMDLLVVYDRKNKCLSTFMFDGKVEAVGGIINAEASLIYENVKSPAGKTLNRYLTLNITAEAGWDTSDLVGRIAELNTSLKSVKEQLDKFQSEVDGVYKHITEAPMKGLAQLSGDYEANEDGVAAADQDTDTNVTGPDAETKNDLGITAGKMKISLELMIRWVRDGVAYSTPKWHIYLGEPARDKRCSFTYLKFGTKGKSICWADIGADGYLCIGNELPDNGALPPIPSKIQEFLSGHKDDASTDMGADLQKANRSRSKAVKNMLKEDNVDGGVMVGASCWGDIGLNLGLLYGSLESMAGFDASLVHYGNNAVCVNTRSTMGKNGWYAMGQLYAFLEAKLGLHIKIGSLIDRRIKLLYAGIGGVLEMGLPNPSWVEGQARVKINLLAGLVKLNKKFEFSAGDHCVPFLGNALDGFELFSDVSLGSDSLYEALYRPEFAISQHDANRLTFTTNASLGSHFRLVDPSYQAEMAKEVEVEEDSLLNHLSSRTYVFDIDQDLNWHGDKIGVRLVDLGYTATSIVQNKPGLTPEQFYKELGAISQSKAEQNAKTAGYYYQNLNAMVSSVFADKGSTVAETNVVMKSKDIYSQEERLLHGSSSWASHMNEILSSNTVTIDKNVTKAVYIEPVESNVSFREAKGTTFHLSGMNLQPGHSYALFLEGNAYEIMDGKRVWVDYFDSEGDQEYHYIKWRQDKVWFFRVKSYDEDKVIGDSLRNLEPYVALAYPSVDGTKVKSGSEGITTAYIGDIMHPTVALNRDLRSSLNESKMKWVLTPYHADDMETPVAKAQTKNCKFVVNGYCYNMEPESAFSRIGVFTNDANSAKSGGRTYDFENEVYHLELQYTYKYEIPPGEPKREGDIGNLRDSTFCLVDLWLTAAPHDVTVSGWNGKQDDNWMQTTNSNITGSVLPYSEPFVGARPLYEPKFDYQNTLYELGLYTKSDLKFVFEESNTYKGLSYRLIDPYLYFAYLGCWTFIGDRKVDSYAFDDAYIPFASESLIYEYNGTVVNSEMLKNPKDDQGILPSRNNMYQTWNNWKYYTISDQPFYPLPTTLKNIGGPTVNNQDGKTATVVPINMHRYRDYRYCLQDMAQDFMAPYGIATQLSQKLRSEAQNLWSEFALCWYLTQNNLVNWSFYDGFDDRMKVYNNLHRGQYISIADRGFSVRIPYYQLPLIFGDCFGEGATFMGKSLKSGKRTFSTTIGKGDMTDSDRWPSTASNLLFWRLMGTSGTTYGLSPEVFVRYTDQWHNDCYLEPKATSRKVAWDEFNARAGLDAVTQMQCIIYRVNAYDVNSGLYTVVKGVGGGPADQTVTLATKDNTMAKVYDELTQVATTQENNYDTKRPQAIWSSAAKTLYLTYSDEKHQPGSLYDGQYVDGLWLDDEVKDAAWNSTVKETVEKVVIDATFKDVDLRSLTAWFGGCKRLTTIIGLSNLNTAKVTDMQSMFNGCTSLTQLDLRSFNTEKVTSMYGMFLGCSALTTLKLSSFDTKNVTDMMRMFMGCKKLTTLMLDGNKFNTAKVTKMNYMFYQCESLKTLDLKWLRDDALTSTYHMFWGCKALTHLYLNNLVAYDVKDTEGMFGECTSLKTICLNEFIPQIKYSDQCKNMFTNVPQNLLAYINYDLDDRIKAQIPGQKILRYSENVQAVHIVDNKSQNVLLFLNSPTKYEKGFNGTIGDTGRKGTVQNAWSGSDVLQTSTPKWSAINSQLNEVVIDKSFKQSPTYVYGWFDGCRNLTKIEGLRNLDTRKAKTMQAMFRNCSKLTDLSETSYFQTDSVTNMNAMFEGCTQLTSVGTYNWRTQNVTNMRAMFKGCRSLTRLNFDYYFDTDNVTDMGEMFMNCVKLERIDCKSSFNTAKVTTMASMFEGCAALEDVYNLTSSMDGSSLITINQMFKGCSSLKEIEMPSFSTPKTVQFGYAFSKCTSLKLLDLSSLSSESLSQCTEMFQNLPYPCTIYLPYNISDRILDQLKSYSNLILIHPAKVLLTKNSSKYILTFLSSETTYKIGDKYNGNEIVKVWTGKDVFNSDNPSWSIKTDITQNISSVTIDPSFSQIVPRSTNYWFRDMNNITTINGLANLNLSMVRSMKGMFRGCTKLKSVNMNFSDAQEVTNLSFMFYGCKALTSLDLSSFDTRRVTDMSFMFSGCSALKSLDLSNFLSWNLTKITSMFYNCSSLTELDLTAMDTKAVPDAWNLFSGATSLTKLRLGQNFTFDKITGNSNEAFNNVGSLVVIVPEAQLESIRQKFTENMGFEEGVTGDFYTSEPEPVAQAIWSEDNATLTFYYGPKVSGRFRGMDVTQAWSGSSVESSPNPAPWLNACSSVAKTVVFDPTFASVKPVRLTTWFKNFTALTAISGMEYLNTSEVTTVTSLFHGCSSLTTVDLSHFKLDKCSTLGYMFYGCRNLTSVDLKGLGSMPKLVTVVYMFTNCSSLTTIDMADIRTTNVTRADGLFSGCTKLRDLTLNYLGLFDKVSPKATDAFKGVTNLEVKAPRSYGDKTRTNFTNNLGFVEGTNGYIVDESEVVTEAIWTEGNTTLTFARKRLYNVGETFNGQKVTAVWSGDDVMRTSTNLGVAPKWVETVKSKLTKVVFDDTFPDQPGTNNQYYPLSFSSWFDGCSKLTSVTGLKNARSERASKMAYMFRGCSSLTTLDLSEFKTTTVTSMTGMFEGCTKLKTLNLGGVWTGNVTSMSSMFKNCSALTSLDLSGFSTSKVTSMSDMFYGCSALTSLKLSNFNTANVTSMSAMFQGCSALTSLDIANFNTSKVISMDHMFYQCKALTSIPTGNFNTAKVTDMSYMFYSCNALWKPDVKNFNTSLVKNMSWMFANCSAATTIDVSGFDTQYVEAMNSMFQGCSSLKSLTLSSFNTKRVTSMLQMFYNCKNLQSLDLSTFNTLEVTNMRYIFGNCTALTKLKVSNLFNTKKVIGTVGAFLSVNGITAQVPGSWKSTVTNYLTKLGFVEGTTGTITTY